ncbi:MAG: O-antigen ligase family protein [Thermodesulfovibrionales bacterium]
MFKQPLNIIFLFLLVFAPLAFGTVEAWSLLVMEGLALLCLLLCLRQPGQARPLARPLARPFRRVPGLLPLLLLCLYHLLQAIPLPAGLIGLLSPATLQLFGQADGLVSSPGWISLSVSKKATLAEFFRFASAAALYIVTVQLFSAKEPFKKSLMGLLFFCGLLALLSIMQSLFSSDRIFWFRKLTYGGSPFGPFVNRNHYAGFMGMLVPIGLGIFLYYKPRVSYASLRQRLYELFSRRRTNIHILAGLCVLLMAVSVFLTLSRSGIVSLGLSLIFFGLLLTRSKTEGRRGIILAVVCLLVLLVVGWFGWDPIIARFEKVRNPAGNIADLRPVIWKDTMSLVRDFPVFGTGFGTYIDVYTKYRTLPGEAIVDHAHNDYLELLSDGGLIGFLLYVWFLAAVVLRSWKKFLKRRDSFAIYLFIGSLSGILYMLFHSLTDFNLHIGSNGLYFFFLCGVLVSSAHTRLRDGLDPTLLKPLKGAPSVWTIALAGLLLCVCLAFNAGGLIGAYYERSLKGIRPEALREQEGLRLVQETLERAVLFDPLEPRHRLALADLGMLVSGPEAALREYEQAVIMDPLEAEYLQKLGLARAGRGEAAEAERLLKAGIALDRNASYVYRTYALWLFTAGRRVEAMANIKTVLTIDPSRTREYITLMLLNGLTNDEMQAVMPELVVPHLSFADYLVKTGSDDMAEAEYRRAFDFIGNEKEPLASYFYQARQYFMKKGMYEEALAVMRKGVAALPEDAGLRVGFGEVYEKMGMMNTALEEYKKALLVDPYNLQAKRKIEEPALGESQPEPEAMQLPDTDKDIIRMGKESQPGPEPAQSGSGPAQAEPK